MTWIYNPDGDKPLTHEQVRQKLAKVMDQLRLGKNPGLQSFRIKTTRKANELYLLKLTWHQRETLVESVRLSRGLKKKIEGAGEGTQVVGVTRKELNELNDELGQAIHYAYSPHKKRLTSVLSKVAAFFEEEHEAAFGIEGPKTRKTRPIKSDVILQFKITLLDIEPAIWRRIQIHDGTLADLHEYIQAVFGWECCHMHQFEINGERFSTPTPDDLDFGLEFKDETKVVLSKLLPKKAKRTRWIYEYDFGDGWRHEVLFEGFPPAEPKAKYPLCLEGERACPPEDCGGPWGYADYLAAIADPEHEQHDEMLEWNGPFESEAFDAKKATKDLRKLK